jgi:hypothetical protein
MSQNPSLLLCALVSLTGSVADVCDPNAEQMCIPAGSAAQALGPFQWSS